MKRRSSQGEGEEEEAEKKETSSCSPERINWNARTFSNYSFVVTFPPVAGRDRAIASETAEECNRSWQESRRKGDT